MAASPFTDIQLTPLFEAIRRLQDSEIRLKMLMPPWPCEGLGQVRVARAQQSEDGRLELVATYDGYVRIYI